MKNHSVAFLTASFLLLAINSPLILAQTNSIDHVVCQPFETLRADYTQSLGKDASGKPMVSEQSVQVAWELAGAAQAHSLLLNDDQRLRHLWIFGEDSMYVDEVLAYADNGINNANAERTKSWSLDMAHQYIAATRELLENSQSEVATQMEGQRCPMSPALRDEVSVMLGCIENVLQSEDAQPAEVSACGGPRLQADLCAQ